MLKAAGISDMDQYHHCPGEALSPDFFLGDDYPAPESYTENKPAGDIAGLMDKFKPLLTPELCDKTGIVFAVDFGESAGKWTFDMKDKGRVNALQTQ